MTRSGKSVVTGASGEIASQILPRLREHYELVRLDVKATDRYGRAVDGVRLADLTDPDREAIPTPFTGPPPSSTWGTGIPGRVLGADVAPIDRFDAEMANAHMAQNLDRCTLEAGGEARGHGLSFAKARPTRRLAFARP